MQREAKIVDSRCIRFGSVVGARNQTVLRIRSNAALKLCIAVRVVNMFVSSSIITWGMQKAFTMRQLMRVWNLLDESTRLTFGRKRRTASQAGNCLTGCYKD